MNNPQTVESYNLKLAMGNIAGHRGFSIFANNPNVMSSLENITNHGGILTYFNSNTQLYASSSDASDTMMLAVQGIRDAGSNTWVRENWTVTLNGQTQVALSAPSLRIFSVVVLGAVDNVGDIYIAEDSTGDITDGVPDTNTKIQLKMFIGENAASNLTYTTPSGKTIYFKSNLMAIGRADDGELKIRIREFGGVWRTLPTIPLYQRTEEFNFAYLTPNLPEKCDIDILVKNATTAASISGAFIMEEVDN